MHRFACAMRVCVALFVNAIQELLFAKIFSVSSPTGLCAVESVYVHGNGWIDAEKRVLCVFK